MPEHIIRNNKGTSINWYKNNKNEDFCLLYNDNNGKYTFTPTENLNCQLYMFGGGGAGGYFFGGGGGAGASYINKNYTFQKNKTYTFEIGTGGKCDINNINLLFTPGILLKVFNNTSPILNNFSFIGEDYSNINIDNNSAKSYIVQDLTIDPSLFNKNTTYIWEGYIKGNTDKNYNFSIVSNLKTFIWIQDYENENMSSLDVFSNTNNKSLLVGGYNLNQHPFSKQMKNNIFYKIKIIAYNDNESINNFNIKIDSNCEIFNFNKENENYKYIKSSDTILTYSNDDGTFGSIKCIGGGNGGCGLYNQDNSYLNGGCGGGSGLNKIKGLSTIKPIYNGFDGAIGSYCGGGGGIMSAGNNANGGDGLILNWFNDTLIFGAGGNAAGNNTTRNLGYGSGGNGGTCCYYSKTLINNNGNNGCIIIYIKSENFTTIEGFTNSAPPITGANSLIPSSGILNDLLKETLNLSNMDYIKREDYFSKNIFAKNSDDKTAAITSVTNLTQEMYMNDLLVNSILYTSAYKLLKHYFQITLNNNLKNCKDNFKTLKIGIGSTDNTILNSSGPVITFASNYSNVYSLTFNTATDMNTKTNSEINALYRINSSYSTNSANETPIYHNINNNGAIIDILNDMSSNINGNNTHGTTNNNILSNLATDISPHNINFITIANASVTTTPTAVTAPTIANGAITVPGKITLSIALGAAAFDGATLKTVYNHYNNATFTGTNKNNYDYQRVFLYLDTFNKILNTDFNIILPTLKYYMYYFNVLIYNAAIQYAYFKLQKYRITYSTANAATGASGNDNNVNSLNNDIAILQNNLNTIIKNNLNVPSNSISVKEDTINLINNINEVKNTFVENQTKLNSTINKYNNYLTMYNNILFYYKIIIAFAIFLTIVIIIIFSSSLLDNNSKISIYTIIAIFIIVIILFYNNTITIEDFGIAHNKSATVYAKLTGTLNLTRYLNTAKSFLNYLAINVSNSDSGLFASDINSYMQSLTLDKKRKAEFYKIKSTTLENNIEIMKKSINYYYYLIVFIASLIVILITGLILYLLFPQLLLQVIILCIILLILSVYFFTYRMHKSTRIYENKNYWANYNPSKSTLDSM